MSYLTLQLNKRKVVNLVKSDPYSQLKLASQTQNKSRHLVNQFIYQQNNSRPIL